MSGALVSLCMIVRDEAELLPRFLAAAAGLWDELIAVDTGSRDATPDLLSAAGARVVARAWQDDFAAARNAGLAEAHGAWVLVLDADEMVTPELARSVRQLAADERAGAVSLPFRDELPHGHVRESVLLRMFRADASIRFRHAIHEDVGWAVTPWLRRTGLEHRVAAGRVDHLGYRRERAEARGKRERDRAILRECLARDPHDAYSHLKLLEQCRFWDDADEWRRAAAASAQAVSEAGLEGLSADHAGELLALIADGLHPGDARAALRFLDGWAGRVGPSAPYLMRRGELRERLGLLDEAAGDFEACLGLRDRTELRQLGSTRPRMGLARVAIARGDLAGAFGRASEALLESPRDPEALLAGAALAQALGGAAGVERFASELRARHGPFAELDRALGEIGAS